MLHTASVRRHGHAQYTRPSIRAFRCLVAFQLGQRFVGLAWTFVLRLFHFMLCCHRNIVSAQMARRWAAVFEHPPWDRLGVCCFGRRGILRFLRFIGRFVVLRFVSVGIDLQVRAFASAKANASTSCRTSYTWQTVLHLLPWRRFMGLQRGWLGLRSIHVGSLG